MRDGLFIGSLEGLDGLWWYGVEMLNNTYSTSAVYLSSCPLGLSLGEDLKSTMNDVQRQTAGTCVLFADLVVFAFELPFAEAATEQDPHEFRVILGSQK